jgi:hypothetical protein
VIVAYRQPTIVIQPRFSFPLPTRLLATATTALFPILFFFIRLFLCAFCLAFALLVTIFSMRLLQIEADGHFSLVEYVESDIPRYAILSHTWGPEEEEVTYRDLMQGAGNDKAGYRKLTFCGRQAANDSLQFFWLDTCCIDKSSSAELSEAINSMFRWYKNAARCYVYLSDVSTSNFARDIQYFRESRWFTRGWTLQELLAPTFVDFYSREGDLLGDRESLVQHITEVTSIPIEAFQGTPLNCFSIEARMSWLGKRTTKRGEDAAYCLLGIFNAHMPLLYGEGQENAFDRLREQLAKQNWKSGLSPEKFGFRPSKSHSTTLSTKTHNRRSSDLSAPDFESNQLQPGVRPSGFGLLDAERNAEYDYGRVNEDVEATFKESIIRAGLLVDMSERGASRSYMDPNSGDEITVNKPGFSGIYTENTNGATISKLLPEGPGGTFGNNYLLHNATDLANLLQRFAELGIRIDGITTSYRSKLG